MGKGGCCTPDDWQREVIPDHKFDYINVDEFTENSFFSKLRYSWVFMMTLKSVLVYMADIGVLVINLANLNQLQRLLNANGNCDLPENRDLKEMFGTTLCQGSGSLIKISVPARLGIIFGSIFLSFLLLFIEWRKAQKIIKSRDISYAFTSVVAYRYYVIQSYPHFCFFSHIQNSRRTVDILAFFVFFRFKGKSFYGRLTLGWKKLLFAELPRIVIYALLLIEGIGNVYDKSTDPILARPFTSMVTFYNNQSKSSSQIILAQYILMSFTVLIWVLSFLALLVAFFIYIPLLSRIRGNLKEYCCHKIDKRIAQILRKKTRKRMEEARKNEGAGYYEESEYGGSTRGGYRAAPPLGITMGPAVPSVTLDPSESNYTHPVNAIYVQYPHPTTHFYPRSEPSDLGSESGTLRSDQRMGHYYYYPYTMAPPVPPLPTTTPSFVPSQHTSVGHLIDHYAYPPTPAPIPLQHASASSSLPDSQQELLRASQTTGSSTSLHDQPAVESAPGVQLLYPGHAGHPYPMKSNHD